MLLFDFVTQDICRKFRVCDQEIKKKNENVDCTSDTRQRIEVFGALEEQYSSYKMEGKVNLVEQFRKISKSKRLKLLLQSTTHFTIMRVCFFFCSFSNL